MTNQHPITPPPNLVEQWWDAVPGSFTYLADKMQLATAAAQWGADQELNACCEWTQSYAECGDALRLARRPKPPSLTERALAALRQVGNCEEIDNATFDTIRQALERLKELERPNDQAKQYMKDAQ